MRLLPRRLRCRLIWLTLFALLFQQVALAAHACEQGPAAATSAMAHAHADAALHCESPATEPDAMSALCAKHCAPDHATAHEPAIGKLPALPPLQLAGPVRLPCSAGALDAGIPPAQADPPTLRRYGHLLI